MKTIIILSHVTFDDSPYCSYVHRHAKELVKQGYQVIVLAIINWFPILSHFQNYKKEFMKKMKQNEKVQIIGGVKVIYRKAFSVSNFLYNSPINLNGIFYYLSIKNIIKKLIQKEEVIGIDAHTYKVEGYVAYRLKKKYSNITTTITLHGTSFFRNTKTKYGIKSIKKIFDNVDYAVCVSNKIQKILDSFGITNSKMIFNGINQYEFSEIDKENYKYNILSVGALILRKKFDLTIKAIKELIPFCPLIKLTIVGVGEQKENLLELVKQEKLEDYIYFTNQLPNEDVLKLMNQSNIFLLPSINEGFGIVYAEAMKARCLTIGTIDEGIDGFIKNEKNGFLVNPDTQEIVNLIRNIYTDKYHLEKIRENAYSSSKELTWEKNAKEYCKLFFKLNNK